MKARRAVLLLASTLLVAQDWQIAKPGYRFEFPRDHFSHPQFETEWWYYTGNLTAADGRRYGFELTFFRQGTHVRGKAHDSVWNPDQFYVAHLALSDVDGHTFYHRERINRAGPGLAGAGFADGRYWNGNWQVRWTDLPNSRQELTAVCDRFTLELTLDPAKPPVTHGNDGVSVKGSGPGQASHYISFTRLEARGQLAIADAKREVSGTAWMDHEFFTEAAGSELSGWDWFAIQLENREELMLYRLRDKRGQATGYSSGSYIDATGKARFLSAKDFELTAGAEWTSPHTKARYPLEWRIRVPLLGLDLKEQTDLQDQELWSANGLLPSYWEGSVRYDGRMGGTSVKGVGYLEMTGYNAPVRLSSVAHR